MAPRNGQSLIDGWCTPKWLADLLGEFDLDPCSNSRSHVRAKRMICLDNGHDGLYEVWHGSVFVNPPYSKPMPWCRRLATHSGLWVALVKLDTSTKWWAELMSVRRVDWAPFRERLRFEPPDGIKASSNNFCSALVWSNWGPSAALSERLWLRR